MGRRFLYRFLITEPFGRSAAEACSKGRLTFSKIACGIYIRFIYDTYIYGYIFTFWERPRFSVGRTNQQFVKNFCGDIRLVKNALANNM